MNYNYLEVLNEEIEWISRVMGNRWIQSNGRYELPYITSETEDSFFEHEKFKQYEESYSVPDLKPKESQLHRFIEKNGLILQERLLLAMLLILRVDTKPQNFSNSSEFNFRNLIQGTFITDSYTELKTPTLSTWLHILNSRDSLESLKVLSAIENEEYFLFKNGYVKLREFKSNLPLPSAIISLDDDFFKSIITNKEIA